MNMKTIKFKDKKYFISQYVSEKLLCHKKTFMYIAVQADLIPKSPL